MVKPAKPRPKGRDKGDSTHSGRGFFARHRALLVTSAIFIGSLIASFWLLLSPTTTDLVLVPFTRGVATVTVWVFRIFGQNASMVNETVTVNGRMLTIAQGCNGLEALAFFLSAVIAFPTEWRRKCHGAGMVIVGILVINQIRVVALFLVEMVNPDWLLVSHNYIGQTFVIVMGCGVWLLWAERVFRSGRGTVRERREAAA